MKILFVYPRFQRHAEAHPELLRYVPLEEYLGSPSLAIPSLAALVPGSVPGVEWTVEYRDDRLAPADQPTDADLVALTFFTPAASRGLELARYFRSQGRTVVAGGIFPTALPDEVAPFVDAVVVGEGEEAWRRLLRDLVAGTLQPRYRAEAPCDLSTLPVPDLSPCFAAERETFHPDDYPLQISRGCPLHCHACMVPPVMGSEQRAFPIEHVMAQVRQLRDAGKKACLTEDTSWFPSRAGRRHLVNVLDALIASGQTGAFSYVGTSMPLILTTPRAVLDKVRQAGVPMFYLVGGFDPITLRAFTGDDPRAWQRGLDAVAMAWDAGIEPYTSFLLGGDQDDEGTVDRMLEFAEKARIRKAEFAISTPYPGTPSWFRLLGEGRILTREWHLYNDANVVFRPARMTPEQVTDGYLRLWREFYADKQHLRDLPRDERTIQF